MDSLSASTLVHGHASSKTGLGEAGDLTPEAVEQSAPLAFAGLLQAAMSTQAVPPPSGGGAPGSQPEGQKLTTTSGNPWPLSLPYEAPKSVMAGGSLEAEQLPPQESNKAGDSAVELFPALNEARLPIKLVAVDARFARAMADNLEAGRETGKDPLLMVTASDEAKLQPLGTARGAEPVGQNLFYSMPSHGASADGQLALEPARFVVSPRLEAPQWQDAFASRLMWIAKEKHQFVELRLNPPELGSVNVRMALQHNDASIAIGVHNAAVREAIEASLPRLRELLAESGVSLMNVDVSSSHDFAGDGRQSATGHDGFESFDGIFAVAEGDPLAEMQAGLGFVRTTASGAIDRYV